MYTSKVSFDRQPHILCCSFQKLSEHSLQWICFHKICKGSRFSPQTRPLWWLKVKICIHFYRSSRLFICVGMRDQSYRVFLLWPSCPPYLSVAFLVLIFLLQWLHCLYQLHSSHYQHCCQHNILHFYSFLLSNFATHNCKNRSLIYYNWYLTCSLETFKLRGLII